MDLKDKTVLVTGANGGIGKAIVSELAARGAHVLAGVRELDDDHTVPAAATVRRVHIDLSDRDTIEDCVARLETGDLDILVNNAGQFEGGLLEHHDVARIYALTQATLIGPIHLTRLLLPGMLQRNRGKIVNNASIVGHVPFPGATVYAAAKAGLHGFTESLRRELVSTEIGVLELITPGIDTEMMDQVQRQLGDHVNTDNWDHVQPEDWAAKVADAIESDKDELNPGGAERLAKLLPERLVDFGTRRMFSR